MPKQVDITPDVRAVLERGAWAEGGIFHLPEGHLERPLYEACDKVLRALGGKWDRKARGHRFAADQRQALDDALNSGVAVDQKRTLEQFFTPADIAERLADAAGLSDGDYVLEPSAGAGALVFAAMKRGCHVSAVEIDPDLAARLKADVESKFDRMRFGIAVGDFLEWKPQSPQREDFDAVAMNPPFGRGKDMAHVTHALGFLRSGGTLAAIMSPHWTFAKDSAAQAFRGLINEHSYDWTPLPEGSFRAADTGVATGILTIRKGTI
jgi:predicted RNA methylase